MKIVMNASPIILLHKINRLDLLNKLFDCVLIPEAVVQEINAVNSLDEPTILSNISYKCIKVTNRAAIASLLGRLHLGEVEVMVGALEQEVATVVLDDFSARNKAKQLGLSVTGTLGIIVKAKNSNLIKDIAFEVEGLKAAGIYISDDIIQQILND